METIKLNDVEYVKKEEYDNLKAQKEAPQVPPVLDLSRYFVIDAPNVCAIVPFNRDTNLDAEILELPEGTKDVVGFYKKINMDMVKVTVNSDLTQGDAIYLSKSKYST